MTRAGAAKQVRVSVRMSRFTRYSESPTAADFSPEPHASEYEERGVKSDIHPESKEGGGGLEDTIVT